jgi:hypothetical protein
MIEWIGEWGTWGSLVERENLLVERLFAYWFDPMEYLELLNMVNHYKYL